MQLLAPPRSLALLTRKLILLLANSLSGSWDSEMLLSGYQSVLNHREGGSSVRLVKENEQGWLIKTGTEMGHQISYYPISLSEVAIAAERASVVHFI